jgi:signal transduction histidine kinase
MNEIILDIVNVVTISFLGVSIETRLGDNIGGGRGGSIHDNNDNNREVEIYADKSRITQAISNIVDSAVKFTGKGAIGIERFVSIDNKRLEIQVTDSGNGIAEDILPNLFGRFVTRTIGDKNKRGTGLALYISKPVVDCA